MSRKSVVDEDELNDWIWRKVKTGGFSASVTIDKWDEKGIHPLEITITLSYKTGDGCDQPYGDYPPDDAIFRDLEEHGWKTDAEGGMKYGIYCPKCDENFGYEEVEFDDEALYGMRCPKCGSEEIDEIEGHKWIYGYKTIKLKGTESARKIKQIIKQTIEQVI